MNKLGYTKVEILIVIVLLGVVAFITINSTSYAFAKDDSGAIKEVINLIEIQAKEYAEDNKTIFDDTNVTYITVSDLVSARYLIGNEEGKIINPANSNENYNDNKIKLELEKDNTIKASLII